MDVSVPKAKYQNIVPGRVFPSVPGPSPQIDFLCGSDRLSDFRSLWMVLIDAISVSFFSFVINDRGLDDHASIRHTERSREPQENTQKLRKEMSAAAGIRTRAMSLEGSDPNQLDHSCTKTPLSHRCIYIFWWMHESSNFSGEYF